MLSANLSFKIFKIGLLFECACNLKKKEFWSFDVDKKR
jgi:hypothetical protein